MLDPAVHLLATVGVLERTGPVTVAAAPVPVVITATWGDGSSSEHRATASAWTAAAVEVHFPTEHRSYRVWLPAAAVRRA